MKCKSCGFEIKENKKFCTNCGFKIEINLKESENQIKNEKVKDKIKTINNQKYSSAKGNKTKNNFLIPLGGILGFAFIAIVASLTAYDYEDNYVKSYGWLEDYLKSDGDCCNDNFYAIDRNKSKLLVLNSILEINANDSEALRQKEKVDREIAFNLENKYLKTFGDYSLLTNKVEIDVGYFQQNNIITYEVYVNKKGKLLENKFSFNCNGTKYDWAKREWRKPRNKNEKSIIKNICLEKRLDPKKMSLLNKSGWKQYPNYHWVDIKNWSEETSTEWKNYITKYHNPFKENISKISVSCDDNTITFLKNDNWSNWEKLKGSYKQIFVDSPCN